MNKVSDWIVPLRKGTRGGPWAGAILALLLALTAAGEARAQCATTNPEMICPLAVCIALQADVVLQCKTPAPISCNSVVGCSPLRVMKTRWLACGASRSRVNVTCFGGGNLGHQTALAQVYQNVGTCDARIALPQPIGCTDPCPVPLAATSSTGDEDLLAQLDLQAPWQEVVEAPGEGSCREQTGTDPHGDPCGQVAKASPSSEEPDEFEGSKDRP